MIDGCHRMRKILNETSKTHSEFYVLKNEEFMNACRNIRDREMRTNDEHLVVEKIILGIGVTCLQIQNHEELMI